MRLGRVSLRMEYVIDLDNENMVYEARDCIVSDVDEMVKFDEYDHYIKYEEDGNLSERDIPSFLIAEDD